MEFERQFLKTQHMKINQTYKENVREALLLARKNHTGSDAAFARSFDINPGVYNAIKKGDIDKKLSDDKWLEIGIRLNVSVKNRKWNMAETDVYKAISSIIRFCKEHSTSEVIADECAIGKTYTAQYMARTLENCFYVDASQYRSKVRFIKAVAGAIGVNNKGCYSDVFDRIKYSIAALEKPIIIIDEAGDMCNESFMDIKGLQNGTKDICGWVLIGADGLRAKIKRGIEREKQGYKELFSRLGDKCLTVVPKSKNEKIEFYRKLITDVLSANISDRELLRKVVNKCLRNDMAEGESTGLRRAETILILETSY